METLLYIQGKSGRMGQSIGLEAQDTAGFGLAETLDVADVVIDVSAPEALGSLVERCVGLKKPLVIGTTGHDEAQRQLMQAAAGQIPLLYAPNFSFGMALLREAVSGLAVRVGPDVRIEIIEAHRKGKKDRPSGSALALEEAMGREIPIHSIRVGDTIGDHAVLFGLDEEELELKHRVHSRRAFAKGALRAATFLKNQNPGYYTLCHLLK